jgi:hypothetical protein
MNLNFIRFTLHLMQWQILQRGKEQLKIYSLLFLSEDPNARLSKNLHIQYSINLIITRCNFVATGLGMQKVLQCVCGIKDSLIFGYFFFNNLTVFRLLGQFGVAKCYKILTDI